MMDLVKKNCLKKKLRVCLIFLKKRKNNGEKLKILVFLRLSSALLRSAIQVAERPKLSFHRSLWTRFYPFAIVGVV